jgi:hypothetical protein
VGKYNNETHKLTLSLYIQFQKLLDRLDQFNPPDKRHRSHSFFQDGQWVCPSCKKPVFVGQTVVVHGHRYHGHKARSLYHEECWQKMFIDV